MPYKLVSQPEVQKNVFMKEMKSGQIGMIAGGAYAGETVLCAGGEFTKSIVSLTNPRNYWESNLNLNTVKVRLLPGHQVTIQGAE